MIRHKTRTFRWRRGQASERQLGDKSTAPQEIKELLKKKPDQAERSRTTETARVIS